MENDIVYQNKIMYNIGRTDLVTIDNLHPYIIMKMIDGGNNMRKKYLLLTAVLLLFVVSGCIRINTKEKVGIRGEILKLNLNDKGKVTSIYVEGKIDEDTIHDKASVSINEKTKIYNAENKTAISVNDLKEGMKVEIVFEGGVRESYPVQADAKSIKIIK